jgi:hypothetical protein
VRSAVAPARPLWAGPGAARVLAGSGVVGVVEIALHPGGYVRFGEDGWLLVAVLSAPRGPLTVCVAGLEAAPLRPGDEFQLARTSTSSTSGRETLHSRAPGWREALSAALAEVPPVPPELAPGLDALRRGDLDCGVFALAGRGEGLTPTGDDVLAGFAAWRHASGRPVSLGSDRCSPLGLAYLRCAQRGELAEPAHAVLRAVRAGDAAGARRRARGLARWGSSSGAAILWGMAAAA